MTKISILQNQTLKKMFKQFRCLLAKSLYTETIEIQFQNNLLDYNKRKDNPKFC